MTRKKEALHVLSKTEMILCEMIRVCHTLKYGKLQSDKSVFKWTASLYMYRLDENCKNEGMTIMLLFAVYCERAFRKIVICGSIMGFLRHYPVWPPVTRMRTDFLRLMTTFSPKNLYYITAWKFKNNQNWIILLWQKSWIMFQFQIGLNLIEHPMNGHNSLLLTEN